MSAPVQGEFPRHVVGGPEAHDLQEPLARRVGAMSEGEVGEDQRVTGGYWLRLPNHVPGRREPSELSSEALLKPAVVSARRAAGKIGSPVPNCRVRRRPWKTHSARR